MDTWNGEDRWKRLLLFAILCIVYGKNLLNKLLSVTVVKQVELIQPCRGIVTQS